MPLPSKQHPSGPSLRRLKHYEWNLSGTHLAFDALKHNYDRIPERGKRDADINLYAPHNYGRVHDNSLYEPAKLKLVSSQWLYRGFPVLHGLLGEVYFSVNVVHCSEFSSLFRPRHLECAIERFLFAARGCGILQESGVTRLNWQVRRLGDLQWVNYGYQGALWLHAPAEEAYGSVWQTPISSEHLLTFIFKGVIRKPGTRLREVYSQVESTVMQTVELSLSEQSLAERDEVRRQYPDEALPESLPPYEFEEFEPMDVMDIARMYGKKYRGIKEYEEFSHEIDEEEKRQKRKAKEIREKVMQSHLRFKQD